MQLHKSKEVLSGVQLSWKPCELTTMLISTLGKKGKKKKGAATEPEPEPPAPEPAAAAEENDPWGSFGKKDKKAKKDKVCTLSDFFLSTRSSTA